MYSVSQAYLTAKNKIPQTHSFKVSGTIGSTQFDERNILQGSMSISNKCSNGQDIVVGSVNIATLKATFIGDIDIAEGADITFSESLKLADGTYEPVPMGVYRVSEAKKTRTGIVVTAYDRMSFFDKAIDFDTTSGTAYEIAALACQECGVIIGMTSTEMQELPNGTEEFTLYQENDIETYRDMLFWLAQAMACFATADRSGRLVFCPYKQASASTLTNYQRVNNSSFSAFVVRYSGISVVDRVEEKTEYYGLPDDNYLTYNLGSNPFLQYGDTTTKTRIRRAVLDGIANIAYTPFQANVNVGACYDLGDIITNTDGLADGSSVGCIMRYEWKLNRGYMMEGVGSNPALTSARSKLDKNISGILSQTKEDKIQFYTFYNASAIMISDGDTQTIINIRFASNRKTTVVFHAEVLLTAETKVEGRKFYDLVGTVTYRYNELDMAHYHPRETWVDGDHILHLLYYFDVDTALMNHLEILLNADGGDIYIAPGAIRASVYGQSLAASDRWDGTFDIRQVVTQITLPTPSVMRMNGVNDVVNIGTQVPTPIMITDEIARVLLGKPNTVTINGVDDTVEIGFIE